jgi:hypothetical protein
MKAAQDAKLRVPPQEHCHAIMLALHCHGVPMAAKVFSHLSYMSYMSCVCTMPKTSECCATLHYASWLLDERILWPVLFVGRARIGSHPLVLRNTSIAAACSPGRHFPVLHTSGCRPAASWHFISGQNTAPSAAARSPGRPVPMLPVELFLIASINEILLLE